MKRRQILSLIGLSPLALMAAKVPSSGNALVRILIKRWETSKKYTLAVLDAMPEAHLEYRPTEGHLSFVQHFMHLGFTNNAFIGVLMDSKTYPDFNALKEANFFIERPDPINLFQPDHLKTREPKANKNMASKYVNETFDYVISSLATLNDDSLKQGEHKIKPWFLEGHTNIDLILRGENHTSHHRAQAVCYLRMNGIRPPGYSKNNTL